MVPTARSRKRAAIEAQLRALDDEQALDDRTSQPCLRE